MKTAKVVLLSGLLIFASLFSGYLGSIITTKQLKKELLATIEQKKKELSTQVRYTSGGYNIMEAPDLTTAAADGMNAVVNIKTEYLAQQSDDALFNFLFGNPFGNTPIEGTGSGVIISKDGYIVTNNHVVDKASNITITLYDKREFKAKVIGTDPTTDLALVKIDANNLTPINFGNSDNVKVGQWVIAVGNPYGLNSTVTAGIISAKSRNIKLLEGKYAIESFLQTDAAVNPGNSGGALIDANGNLVGLNAAIASPTGSYTGYSFAIPVNLVKKVVADLIEFGIVQRAYLGVKVADIDDNIAKTYNLDDRKGVLVTSFPDKSVAKQAGMKEGDVILKIDSTEVNSVSELLEKIGSYRPKEKVNLTVKRGSKLININVELSYEDELTPNIATDNNFGASFEDISSTELTKYGLKNGVRVSDLKSGKFMSIGIREGYIIININNQPVKSAKEAIDILSSVHGGVYIEGYYPQTNERAYYAFGVK